MKKFKQRPIWQAVVIGLVISTAITLITNTLEFPFRRNMDKVILCSFDLLFY